MRKFLLKNLCIIISAITACIIFAPFLYFIIGKTEPATDLIAAIVAVLIGIISISFPIIIGNTAQRLAAYNNKYIASIFREEATYKRMLHIIPILSGIIIAFFFFSYKVNSHDSIIVSQIIAASAIGLCVYALIVFRKFWDVFSEYNINTDSLVLGKIVAKVKALQEQQKPSAEYLDYMDIYYQILYTKLKAESYIDLINIQKEQSKLVLGVLDNLSENENNDELLLNLRQLFQKYYLSTYLCWRKSFQENADAASDALEEYYRVLNEILPRSISTTIYQPLFFLYQRIAGDLTIRDTRSIPHCRVAPWQWYMNMLSSSIFPVEILGHLDQQILTVMAIVIQNGNQSIFKSFIANTMDGIWFIKDSKPNISDKKIQLIMSDSENKLPRVFSLSEIDDIEKIIAENTQDELLKQNLKQYIQGHYKYNHIRLVVIILGAYCLFKKRYDYIEYLLNYNQPKKGIAHFINPDIIPSDLNILLKFYAETPMFQGVFHHVWEDHNDGQYWFKQFISLLICKLNDKKRPKTHYDYDSRDNKQKLEYYEYCIDEMLQHLTVFDTDIIVACGIPDIHTHLDNIKNTLATFCKEIRAKIGEITKTAPLSEEKIENFKSIVLKLINSNSIWANILTENVNTDASITLSRSVGYNTLIEKSFLAEGDTGIYAGFERSLAEMIVYQIDFFIEHSLRFRASKGDLITKSNFKDKILELDDSWIVLFANYRNMIEWLWNKPGFQWGQNQSHLIGTTNKGTLIYSTADPADRSARVFIFKKDCISKIVGIAEMNIEITDLFRKEELIQKILDTKPQWLENYNTDEEKKDAIQKNVQIKISGEVSFSTVRNLDIYIFDNI